MAKSSSALLRACTVAIAATATAHGDQALPEGMSVPLGETNWPNRYSGEKVQPHPTRDRARAQPRRHASTTSQDSYSGEARQRRGARENTPYDDAIPDAIPDDGLPPAAARARRRGRELNAVEKGEGDESWSAKLRRDLLTGYDRGSYPWESVWVENGWTPANETHNATGFRVGLPVQVGINFHRVFEVDVTNSVADLVVWFRQSWTDSRLVWNPDDYGGLTSAWFWVQDGIGPGGETSEIWTPDLELWNLESSLAESLTDAHASVSHTGSVWWSRPGHLRPVCKFRGLDDFPFDALDCKTEIGSWAYSGLYIRPVKMDEGFSIGGSDTAGEAYAEYTLNSVECEEHLYPPYPAAPEEDWPVIFHRIKFRRAWQPYARGYLVLQIVLNFAAFACFWLPPHCGERMGLAITALLAAVASELVISANLPAASEITWFAKFSLLSLVFAAMALFESAAVIFFHYHTGDDVIPRWAKWSGRWIRSRLGKTRTGKDIAEDDVSNMKPDGGRDSVTLATERNSTALGDSSSDEFRDNNAPPVKAREAESAQRKSVPKVRFSSQNIEFGAQNVEFDMDSSEGGEDIHCDDENSSQDGAGHHQAHTAQSVSPEERPSLVAFQSSLSGSTRHGVKTILGRDADDFKNAKEMENNLYWQKVAAMLDEVSRVVFPVSFGISLAILLGPVEL